MHTGVLLELHAQRSAAGCKITLAWSTPGSWSFSFILIFSDYHQVSLTGMSNGSSLTQASGKSLSHPQYYGECKTNGSVNRSNDSTSCPLWYETEQGKCTYECRKKPLLASLISKCDIELGGLGLLQLGHCMAYNGSNRKHTYTVGTCSYNQFIRT